MNRGQRYDGLMRKRYSAVLLSNEDGELVVAEAKAERMRPYFAHIPGILSSWKRHR